MSDQPKNIRDAEAEISKLLEGIRDRIAEISAASNISTEHAFLIAYDLGNQMRQGYTQRKQQTLSDMSRTSTRFQDSDKPEGIAHGLIIEGFITDWIGIEKLSK